MIVPKRCAYTFTTIRPHQDAPTRRPLPANREIELKSHATVPVDIADCNLVTALQYVQVLSGLMARPLLHQSSKAWKRDLVSERIILGKAAGRDMSDYRVEAAADPASGLFYAEVFYPSTASEPVAKTKPVYASLEEARRRAEDAIKAVFPEQPTPPVWDVLLVDNA